MEQLNAFLEVAVSWVWGIPLVILLIGSGLLFSTLMIPGIQFRGFFHAIEVIRGKYDDPDEPGEISHFQALTTALSATVGLGNIAGVAIAIHYGGPGATFWMILAGLVGMSTKFAECTLAVRYREMDPETGEVHGGPMYYIQNGLGKKWRPLAVFFSIAALVSSFGASNMFQTNQVGSILAATFNIPHWITGVVIATLTAAVIIGGIRRIGRVTSILVPLMAFLYVGGALTVIVLHIDQIPSLFALIFREAFNPQAVGGGFIGVMIQGVRRACFSNEAGLGSAPIAHAAATTDEPVREGVVALLEPFIDTVVICTMTALVILISGEWNTAEINAVRLTSRAFDSILPGFGDYFVPIAVALFAYSTLLSWSYYGEQAVDFLFGEKTHAVRIQHALLRFTPFLLLALAVARGILYEIDAFCFILGIIGVVLLFVFWTPMHAYRITFCILAALGAVWTSGAVIAFSDLMLGLMVVPNLIAVWMLFPKLREETRVYFGKLRRKEFTTDAALAADHRARKTKK